MVRLVNRAGSVDDGSPGRDRPTGLLEDPPMFGRFAGDVFEGGAARRRQLRLRVEGLLALGMAIVACGLTAAVWVQVLAPLAVLIGRG